MFLLLLLPDLITSFHSKIVGIAKIRQFKLFLTFKLSKKYSEGLKSTRQSIPITVLCRNV